MSAPFTAAPDPPGGKLPAVLQALHGLADIDLAPPAFYDQWLATLCGGSSALAARCWLAASGSTWQPIAAAGQAAGLPELPVARLEELRRERRPILSHAAPQADEQPAVAHPDNGAAALGVTEVWVPWFTAGELRGAAVAVFAVAHPQAQQGCLKFVVEACDAVERFHLLHDRREALRQAELKERELKLDAALHRSLDLKTTAAVIANDGRLFLGVDRLAVLVPHGRKFRVAAVSGQTELQQRAGAVRSLADIAAACAPFGRTITFPAATEDVGNPTAPNHRDQPTEALSTYVDRHFVKRFTFVPLVDRPLDDAARGDENRAHEIWAEVTGGKSAAASHRLGALIIETFGELQPVDVERTKIDALARSATGALRNARQYESLWLLPLWRVLGNAWQVFFGPGKQLRTGLILGLLTITVAALFFLETDYTAYCRGKLEPAERRRIFAGLDGVVRKVHVKHGARVNVGDALVELQNTDLDIATVDLQGRRTSAFEQSLAAKRTLIDGSQLSPAERTRLSGEEARLAQEIASFDRQLTLLEEKRKELVIRSPIDGEITTWNADDLLAGRPVRQGQQLLTIARVAGPWELELSVPDDRSGRIVEAENAAKLVKNPQPLRVTYSPAVDPGLVREAKVVEIQNSADLHGPNSLAGGGNIVIVRASIDPADLPQRRPGAEAAAHIYCGRRSVAYAWSRDLVDFFRSRIWFRWF